MDEGCLHSNPAARGGDKFAFSRHSESVMAGLVPAIPRNALTAEAKSPRALRQGKGGEIVEPVR